MNFDQENLLMFLYERGIDTEITTQQTDFVVQLTKHSNNNIIGIAKASTVEEALATVISKLVDDSIALKNVNQFEGLSRL